MDFRRVFLAYLEAPNSILAKNKKIGRILLNLPIFPLSPCLGSLGLLSSCIFCSGSCCAGVIKLQSVCKEYGWTGANEELLFKMHVGEQVSTDGQAFGLAVL